MYPEGGFYRGTFPANPFFQIIFKFLPKIPLTTCFLGGILFQCAIGVTMLRLFSMCTRNLVMKISLPRGCKGFS